MKRLSMLTLTALSMLCLGIALPTGDALSKEVNPITKAMPAKTWLSISGYVGLPEGCVARELASNSKGVWSLTSVADRSIARFTELPPTDIMGEEQPTEVSAYLTADIVRADGSRDLAYGSGPRDIIIITDADGRVTVRFVDFSSPEFNFGDEAYSAYPPEVNGGLASTWLSIWGYVERLEGCGSRDIAFNSKGVWSFTSASGRSVARFIELAPMPTTGEQFELSIYLSAEVVRADGSIDSRFGPGPKDMIIATGNDGRITVRFVDFASAEFNGGL